MASQITNEKQVDRAIPSGVSDDAIEQIRQALAGLQFGTVSIVVQDGVVIQIERTERKRLKRNDRP